MNTMWSISPNIPFVSDSRPQSPTEALYQVSTARRRVATRLLKSFSVSLCVPMAILLWAVYTFFWETDVCFAFLVLFVLEPGLEAIRKDSSRVIDD